MISRLSITDYQKIIGDCLLLLRITVEAAFGDQYLSSEILATHMIAITESHDVRCAYWKINNSRVGGKLLVGVNK